MRLSVKGKLCLATHGSRRRSLFGVNMATAPSAPSDSQANTPFKAQVLVGCQGASETSVHNPLVHPGDGAEPPYPWEPPPEPLSLPPLASQRPTQGQSISLSNLNFKL